MGPRSVSASILQRGAGQRGRHGAPGAETGRGDVSSEERKSPRAGPGRGGRRPEAGPRPARSRCLTRLLEGEGRALQLFPGDGEKAEWVQAPPEPCEERRGGEGAGRRGRERGAGPARRPRRKLPRSVTRTGRGEAWAGPAPSPRRGGRERGPRGSAPPHRGAHGGRGLHLPAGSHRPRATGPRSLQQQRTPLPPPRTEPETLLLPPARGSQPRLTGGRPPPPPPLPQVSQVRVAPQRRGGQEGAGAAAAAPGTSRR